MPGADTVLEHLPLTAGLLAAILLAGIGALRLSRRRMTAEPARLDPLPARGAPALTAAPPAPVVPAQRICAAFQAWLAEDSNTPEAWASFDQLVRETLGEHLGATRVRCYHVQPNCETLQPISWTGRTPPASGPSARTGLLGHVATTGREYVAGEAAHGPLVDDLAAQDAEAWAWIRPIHEATATIGLIAVGHLHDPAALTGDLRQTVGPLISLCWQHVASLERLLLMRRTDRASGVLTRNDFFDLAAQALDDSYNTNEPVVVAVLALEGLRRLDDTHRWGERDTLIERFGQVIAGRTRSDDLVGRFTDDRFVMLLRRLDSGLGRLIAEKMLAAANDCVTQLTGGGAPDEPTAQDGPVENTPYRIRMRIGLAGSGLARPPLRELLGSALDAVERARKASVAIASDLENGP